MVLCRDWTGPELPVLFWMPAVLTAGGQSWGQEGTLPWLESQLEFAGPYFVGAAITSASNNSELTLKQLTKAP